MFKKLQHLDSLIAILLMLKPLSESARQSGDILPDFIYLYTSTAMLESNLLSQITYNGT